MHGTFFLHESCPARCMIECFIDLAQPRATPSLLNPYPELYLNIYRRPIGVPIVGRGFLSAPFRTRRMDVISFALSVPSVVAGLLRIIEYANAMQGKFEAVPTAMASITAQCSIMNIMLGRVQRLDVSRAVPNEQERTRLLRDVGAIISGCTGTLTNLENLLLSLYEEESSSFTQVSKKGRFLFLWYDERIKDLLSELSSYHSSITLLLATAQW
jgi:hypothetical protein